MHLKALSIVFLLAGTAGCGRQATPNPNHERHRQFEQMMTKVVLVGHSTRTGREGLSGEERYFIDKVTHAAGNTWIFHSRFRHGGREIPVPVPIQIEWAGDTPVITLTDLTIPKVGTYTTRLLLYRGQYAGTWSAERGGGQMFGRIVPQGDPAP